MIFVESFGAALSAQARLFDAAEGGGSVRGDTLVDSDEASVKGIGAVKGAVKTLGENTTSETVFGVVGTVDGLSAAMAVPIDRTDIRKLLDG